MPSRRQSPPTSAPPGSSTASTNGITEGGTTDNYQVSYHGQTVAHIDTWCHFFENGQMYNGVPVKDNLTPEAGCIKGSVMNWKDGITTRAVLYDIAQLKGVDWVDPNDADHARRPRSVGEEVRREGRTRRHPAALYRPLEATRGARPVDRPGRGLLRRHDSVDARAAAGVHRPRLQHRLESAPGLGRACATRSMSPSSTGWASTSSSASTWSRRSQTARRLNRYEFVITFAPLPVEGGTGSPVNPLAIF